MIIIKQLRWANAFSYGPNNSIDFTKSPLTQFVGKNGHGKTSIALILEEVLFNKNSKGIKKGDIINRHISEKHYTIELDFEVDGVEYTIETKRGSTQSVKLLRGSEDISSHTATATYKQIEEILGIDHKAFTQIVYQSHAGSLEFLTSPDTARKKFLIELLGLSSYTEMGEHFKGIANTLSKEVAAAEGKVSTITEWIKKYNSADLTEKSIKDVPELPDTAELTQLQSDLDSIEQTNKKIAQNITYIQLEAKAKSGLMPMPEQPTESEEPLISAKTKATTEYNAAEAFVKKMSALHGTCPTCLSSIDEAKVSSLVEEQQVIMSQALNHRDHYDERLKQLRAAKSAWEKAQKAQTEWEKYHQLIDPKLPQELQDAAEISSRITSLSEEIKETKRAIKNIQDANNLAVAHNSKVAVIKGQMAEMQVELEEWGTKLNALSNRASMLAILVKTFSTTGLVAYKIENLVKDLEELTNTYLGELSGGRFQITFQISGSDKLNVVVTDNGTDIDIVALSGGERARVNIATLLAIRKLMQSLSKSRLNLLILDETVEALDPESKEKLIEVLLNEENLNIILVSHSFSHPLLEKVHIVKRNNISRIEE